MRKIFLYILLLLIVLGIYGFFNFGTYLNVTDKPRESDIIVCLGGGKHLIRVKKSLELYRLGFAKKKILLVTGGTKNTEKDHNNDDRMNYLGKQEDNISVVYNPYTKNTAEEIRFIKNYMKEHNYKTALIVTEPPHSKRISILADIVDTEQNIDMIIVSSEPKWWDNKEFYLNRHAKYTALSEFVKIPYNYLVYGILDNLGCLSKIHEMEEEFKLREYFHQFIKTNIKNIENNCD